MGWWEPDVGEMDAGECGGHARGMMTTRGNGVGRDFQRRLQAETVRGPAWALISQARGVVVDGSNAEGSVRKGSAGRAIGPGRC